MDEIYEVIGMCYGSFHDDKGGRDVYYANLFVKGSFKEAQAGTDYHTKGEKCFVMKCEAPDTFKDVEPGDSVKLFFNQYGKVTYIVPAA